MAEVTPGFEAGEGSAEQLPRGEAAQANENTNVEAPEPLSVDTVAPGETTDEVLDPAEPSDYASGYQAADEDEAFLIGPSYRPNEAVTEGVSLLPAPVPESLRRSMTSLLAAANTPGAPRNMRTLVKFLIREASR